VEGLSAESAYTFVRLLSETQPIENIRIRDITGGCRSYAVNMDNWAFPQGSGDIRNIDIRNLHVTKVPGSSMFPLVDIRLNVRDLLIEDFERVEDDHSASTLTIENLTRNVIKMEDVSARDLVLTTEGTGTVDGTIRPLSQTDGSQVDQVLIKMRDNCKLALLRGGIKRLEMNRGNIDAE